MDNIVTTLQGKKKVFKGIVKEKVAFEPLEEFYKRVSQLKKEENKI
jgi:hypothetical protein